MITVAWGAGLGACAAALIGLGDLRARPRAAILVLLLAGVIYGGACLWLHRRWKGWDRRTRGRVVAIVLGLAVLLRILLLLVPSGLSDDIYRYRWDGRVQAAGFNPYRYPPAATDLAELRDPLWERINYPTIRTIYPPVAQWLFLAVYGVGGSLLSFRIAAVVGDLLAILLLLACLRSWKLPEWRVALYAWSPLAAVEVASGGHFDAWVIAAALAAILAIIEKRHAAVSTTLSALAVGFKTWPAVLLALPFRDRPRWHVLLATALLAALYAPYASAGVAILQPWMDYAGRWLFNDAGLALLRLATGSLEAAKALAATLGVAALVALWRRGADPIRGGYWLLLLFVLLMPAIHPWYLLWPLPLAAAALDVGWIALTVLAPLSYWILVGAGPDPTAWVEPTWVRFAVYLPALALWAWQSRRHGPPAPPGVLSDPSAT